MSETNGHTLGDVASFIRGITFTPDDVTLPFEKGTAVCMRTKNVQADLDEDDLIAIPKSFVRRTEQYLTEGDMLVSSANSWNLVGKCSWVPKLDYEATAGGFISILRADRKQVDPRYLYHWFAAPRTQHEVRLCGRQTTNISNLNYERCLNLPIPLPKLEEQKRIAALGQKAKNLKQLLAEVAAERERAEAERTKQAAAEEAERKRQEELRRKPRMVFAEAKGKLEYPAQGQIMRRFGDKDALGGSTQGLMIATRQGAQVTTPVDGKVEFAGPFRSYGQLLIVNPGGGYRVLMAGLDKVTAATGEFLRAGEPVGVMGNGPASVTLFGDVVLDGRPVLYIEFRNSTEAIDSDPWWIGGLREARG